MCPAEDKLDRCKAVILVGGRDFGRCPLASRFNRALWPVFGTPAMQVLLEQLNRQGIQRVVISSAGQSDTIRQNIQCPPELTLTFQESTLPRGPAGCIRDAAEPEDEHLLVLSGSLLVLPDVHELFQKHRQAHADMTVFLNPSGQGQLALPVDSQIYLCEPTVLSCIPESGYFDLKEGFIPASMQSGLTIRAVHLSKETRHYRNWTDYLIHLGCLLIDENNSHYLPEGFTRRDRQSQIWTGHDVSIAENAKIYGPVVIGSRSTIADGAMIFGPAVIGEDTHIGPGCLIEESILWDHVTAAPAARIKRSLICTHSSLGPNQKAASELIISPRTPLQRMMGRYRTKKYRRDNTIHTAHPEADTAAPRLQQMLQTPARKISGAVLVMSILLALVLSYWNPTLRSLVTIWLESDEYSSGLLVPFLAVYVLWLRRDTLSETVIRPCFWALAMLIVAQGVRFFGLYFMFASAERLSFILSIGAVSLFVLGWDFFKKFLPVFLFLFLMLPLPNRVEGYLAVPLQAWATVSSVFSLEILGFSVFREGNVININGTLVAVAEACNGLRMLTAFIVVSGLVALTVHRSRSVKLVILLSSIPIALACNTLRLIITAIAFTKLDTERWEKAFHDFGGFAMMPVALVIILFELWLLSRLLIEPNKKQQQVIYRNQNGRA